MVRSPGESPHACQARAEGRSESRVKVGDDDDADMNLPAAFDHESWQTAVGTFGSYLLVLGVLFVALFVVPFLLFLALG